MGIGVAALAALFHQLPPFEQDVFRGRQYPLGEGGPQSQGEPVVQLNPPRRVFLKIDPKPNFGDADDADIERVAAVASGRKRLRAAPAWACAFQRGYWYQATTPSENDVSHVGQENAGGGRQVDIRVGEPVTQRAPLHRPRSSAQGRYVHRGRRGPFRSARRYRGKGRPESARPSVAPGRAYGFRYSCFRFPSF